MFKLSSLLLLALSAQAQQPRMLTLREAMQLAEKLNPDVQLANLRILEAEARTKNVRSAYQPQIGVAITGTYQAINLQNIWPRLPRSPQPRRRIPHLRRKAARQSKRD